MWPDRVGSPGTFASQNSSRAASPLPRRTSSARGPYVTSQQRAVRGSSLSLASNDSTSSLLGSTRKPNGSNLKQSTTIADGTETAELLAKLLGNGPPTRADESKSKTQITEEDLELDFDFGGLSLNELAQRSPAKGDLLDRPQTIEDYGRDKAKFENLHKSIQACDDILNSVETNLTSFRNDLAVVSADIETLQARSTALNVRLENRKAVEKGLGPIVEELSISPAVVTKISEGNIDEQWVLTLKEVDMRATAFRNEAPHQKTSKAYADLAPLLEKLILKAVERIRDFLVAQIKALRSPNINAQIIQQHNFLRFKDLFSFLHRHHATLAEEICKAYMNTMRWYYLNQFTRYEKSLAKLKLHILDKTDVLAHDDVSRKTTVLSGSKISGPPHDAFNLGRRIDILKTPNQAALSSYVAEEDASTHYLEVPFRNFNLAIIDNATAEYTFLASFFSPALSLAAISRNFNYIFEPTFALGQTLTRTLVSDTYDCLGILLCIRLNQRSAFQLQRRKIPAVDGYVNATNMLLWPRLQVVMNLHCESISAHASALPTRAPSSSPSGPGAGGSVAPHVTTQRFAQLLHGVLVLSTEAGDDEPVVTTLRRLRSEVEVFLSKHSQAWLGRDKRKRERFLYNNYSLVVTIISDASGKLAVEMQDHFERLKKAFEESA